ncbi:hypothetical protein OG756_41680 (plasmid) [Streptomyces sp. NBC_01310]|nr:hypothetical protein OG756_41680 [Streptomyces sp. NBC_01310]
MARSPFPDTVPLAATGHQDAAEAPLTGRTQRYQLPHPTHCPGPPRTT